MFYGFVAGLGGWPHFAVLNLIGALLGVIILNVGLALIDTLIRRLLPAGYSCGVGLIGMTSIAEALISKAVSQVIF